MKFGMCESEVTFSIIPYGLCSFYPNIYSCFCTVIPVISHIMPASLGINKKNSYIAGKIPGKYAD